MVANFRPAVLVSWWPGDGNANDIIGTNNGTLVNGATFAAGQVAQAFSFDGVNDYLQLSFDAGIFTNQFTIDAWAFPTKQTPDGFFSQGIFDNDLCCGVGVVRGMGLSFTANPTGGAPFNVPFVSGFFHNSVGTSFSLTAVTTLNAFHHYAVTYDGSELCLYQDGVQESCLAATGNVNDNNLNFRIGDGQFISQSERFFGGLIDEVEIFNLALSSSEIQAIFNAGSGGKCKPQDQDNDGILDEVDTQPATFSDDFSDGTTTGTITDRGDQILKIKDATDPTEGIVIIADLSGGSTEATVSACNDTAEYTLTPGDEMVATCGSVTTQVTTGPVEITLVSADGRLAMVSLSAGNSLTFDPLTLMISAPSTNSDDVVVLIEGAEFSFGPGESKTIVEIDIKPGSDPNSINCNNNNGTIPVAILSTAAFDATTVDHTTVAFEGASERHVNKKSGEALRHEEDVDDDGDPDLVFHFRFGDTDLTCESTEGLLTGKTVDGQAIEGSDAINTVGGGGKKALAPEVEEEAAVPEVYALYQNYPNPFNPTTTIAFDVPALHQVELAVYDVMGRRVATLVDGVLAAGRHEATWQAGCLRAPTSTGSRRVPSARRNV